MQERMDRSSFQVATHEELAKQDRDYWANTTIAERLEMITYLRECFYGPEATTGRPQRVYKVIERE